MVWTNSDRCMQACTYTELSLEPLCLTHIHPTVIGTTMSHAHTPNCHWNNYVSRTYTQLSLEQLCLTHIHPTVIGTTMSHAHTPNCHWNNYVSCTYTQLSLEQLCLTHIHPTVIVTTMSHAHTPNCHWNNYLSHNNPCFPCNIAITNFLILYTCEVRFYDVIDRTVHTFTS